MPVTKMDTPKSDFVLILSEGGKKVYRKEILRVGDFMTDEVDFKITSGNLHHMKKTFDAMRENGIKVPVPLEHSISPEKNRGWVNKMEVDGGSLFASIELTGIDNPNLYDVSVYIPSTWTDGEGHVYAQPIRHVALTSYPRISGLGDFKAIVASLRPDKKGEPMPVDLKKLGVDLGIDKELSEDNAAELVLSHVSNLEATHLGEVKNLKEQLEASKKPEKKSFEALKELALSHPGLIKIGKSGREAKLDSLVGKAISPAVCKGLKELFCSDDAMVLSLDESESDFEKMTTILEKNSLIDLKELTGPQGQKLVLSDPSKGPGSGDSPIVADAKRRAAAAK